MDKKELTTKYLKQILGEHYSSMPKGDAKINSKKRVIEFIFNPKKVSKKFVEACMDRKQLYKYITESSSEKVTMEFPLDESTDESMMTPTASMFSGKRTLQCDDEGRELLREDVEEDGNSEDEEELELNVDEEEEVDDIEDDSEEESNISERYTELAQKTVYDSDGFMTDYTLYYDTETDRFVCIFGDQDFYSPDDSDPDAEFEREAEAYEWFNSYEGIIDDEEEGEEELELNVDEEEVEEDSDDEEELELNVDEEEVEEESLQLRTPVDEDYWFGGDGKMDIPERDDLESGEQEIEIRTDDVTQDNEDQNEEEQEEELNEDVNNSSSMTATEVVDDLENRFHLYFEGGNPGGFNPSDKSKVILGFTYSFLDDKPLVEIEDYLKSKNLKYRLRRGTNKLVVEAEKDNLKLRPMSLSESLIDESPYVIVPRGKGKFAYCDRYGDPILEIEVSTDGTIKVLKKNMTPTLQIPDYVYEMADEYPTMGEFDKDFEYYIKDNLEGKDSLPTEFYTTVFELVDGGPDEVYEYKDLKDAQYHMNLFDDSDADLYKRIYIKDSTGEVIDEKKFVSEGLNEKISETDRLKYSVELIKDDGTSDVHSFANYKSAKNLYDQYDETDGYVKVRLIGDKGVWDALEEKDFSIEPINEEKKVSFKDAHICQGCGKPLSQCTCEVKEESISATGATQVSNIGQHKRGSIDMIEDEDLPEESNMIKSLDKLTSKE